MLSPSERKTLLDMVEEFKISSSVNLASLCDKLAEIQPNRETQEWREWSQYFDEVNKAWTKMNEDNEVVPWPNVRGNDPPTGCQLITDIASDSGLPACDDPKSKCTGVKTGATRQVGVG